MIISINRLHKITNGLKIALLSEIISSVLLSIHFTAQSAGAVEYTYCISAER